MSAALDTFARAAEDAALKRVFGFGDQLRVNDAETAEARVVRDRDGTWNICSTYAVIVWRGAEMTMAVTADAALRNAMSAVALAL